MPRWLRHTLYGLFSIIIGAPLALFAVSVTELWQESRAIVEEQRNYEALIARGLLERSFSLVDLRSGDWRFACVAGEYTLDIDDVAQPFAATHGLRAQESDFGFNDVTKITPWALVLYDEAGIPVVWRMNERLLRYRVSEDEAHGWCFKADQNMQVARGRLLNIPKRIETYGQH